MTLKQRASSYSIHFSQCLQFGFAVVLMIVCLFFYYVRSEKQIDAANEQRYATRLISDQLRQSSDDLTRMVRSYAVTGNQAYLQHFQDIIAIRDGKLPRPANYNDIYWDYVTADVLQKHSPAGQAQPLIELMTQAGFTPNELKTLTEAKIESDKLTEVEFRAIKLVQSAAPNDKNAFKQAQELVFGREYLLQKAKIMALIDQVIKQSSQRTQRAVEETTRRAWLIRTVLIGLGCLLLLLIRLCDRQFRNTLGADPETVLQAIRLLGSGQFNSMPATDTCHENSLMSHLQDAQGKLQQLEMERNKNQYSLYLMSKVFSEAQEGIFLMDIRGTVLDINQAFQNITGYNREESVGHQSLILKSDRQDAEFFKSFWQEIAQEGRWRGEYWCRNKKGDLFASILSFSTVKDNDGNMLCYLGMLTDITQLKTHQHKIEEIAFHDPLTQLPNRPLLADRMQQALARVGRDKNMLTVACLDLDGFKAVNDQFGHGIGDALLVEVARRLLSCVRTCDTVARLGGDEFAILLCEISSREQCEITLQRIIKALAAPYILGDKHINRISGSIGYTLFPYDKTDSDTLLRHADQAMYIAKHAGKNRFQHFDATKAQRTQANNLALARLEKALHKKEFCLYLQPKINLKSGQVVGAEALIRWRHPVRGLMPPAEFLPVIDDNDLFIELGEWVIQEALKLMQQWRSQDLVLPLSINLNIHQLRQENFSTRLASLTNQFAAVPKGHLEIEILESAALGDFQKVSNLVPECKAIGVNFALDDFGTGYSALTHLHRLAVSTLKIDRSLVGGLLTDNNDPSLIHGIIGLAKAFNFNIVAVGVESWRQAACLLNMDCEIVQGYAIAYPMPAAEIVNWIRQFKLPDLHMEQNNEAYLRPPHLH